MARNHVQRQLVTPRELQIAKLVADGVPNKIIAQQLGCAYPTVVRHLGYLYAKVGARDRAHMVAILFRRGILL